MGPRPSWRASLRLGRREPARSWVEGNLFCASLAFTAETARSLQTSFHAASAPGLGTAHKAVCSKIETHIGLPANGAFFISWGKEKRMKRMLEGVLRPVNILPRPLRAQRQSTTPSSQARMKIDLLSRFLTQVVSKAPKTYSKMHTTDQARKQHPPPSQTVQRPAVQLSQSGHST